MIRYVRLQRQELLMCLALLFQQCSIDVSGQQFDAAAQDCENLLEFYRHSSSRGLWRNASEPVRVKALNLASNGLMGDFPYHLSMLARMEELVLSDNVLRGDLYQLGLHNLLGEYRCQDSSPQVRYFALAAICQQNCGNPCTLVGGLRTLRLDGNQIHGELPAECSRVYKTLKVLDLSSNQLSGALPDTLGTLTQLTDLSLAFNQLTGPIPMYIGLLTNLRFLNLSFNRLSGSIPASMVNLARLEQLDLSVNVFAGPLPPELGVLVSPPPPPCDRPGGACFGATLRNMTLDSHGPCELAEWVMWYVQGYKQPCNLAVTGSRYWCQSCQPPYPSLQYDMHGQAPPHASYADCSDLPAPAPAPDMMQDYPTFPYAPALPAAVPAAGPGPTLRLMVVPRCTFTPSVYAVRAPPPPPAMQ